jgi:hypothetical protein
LPDELTVITFNQDLVIENELATLPIRYGELALQSLYGTVALDAVPGLRNARFAHLVSETGSALPVRLLKLHGSLNWMVKTVERSPRPGTLFPPPSRSRQVYVINDREVSDNIALRTGAIQGRSRWYLWPVVVPPIYDKQRIVAMDLFREVWNRARDALENAERLLLVGYSLPEADILARQMLRRTFTRNEGLDAIECINPDVALVVKLKTVLGPNVVRIFHDIPSYLAQTA